MSSDEFTKICILSNVILLQYNIMEKVEDLGRDLTKSRGRGAGVTLSSIVCLNARHGSPPNYADRTIVSTKTIF